MKFGRNVRPLENKTNITILFEAVSDRSSKSKEIGHFSSFLCI